MLKWAGNVEGATAVVGILVRNAVNHADPGPTAENRQVRLRLAVTEAQKLTIDVRDPIPQFRDFEQAAAGQEGRGLWTLRRLGGELSWFLCHERVGKTVRARMTPGPVAA
ncbi:ATP-binding protein [Streptomyces sp. NPDC057557]|uniref:ATP-binding protein n=1 Tax=Streptomyces sp. NPDC057557 TaxID=3346167 RepID=UPI0036B24E08